MHAVGVWVRGKTTVLNQYFGVGDGFEIMQGTSMAAPHVAGAAALAAALQPGWDGTQVKAALKERFVSPTVPVRNCPPVKST